MITSSEALKVLCDQMLNDIEPLPDFPYAGIIHNTEKKPHGYIYKTLTADQFVCPRCQSKRCYVCPCSAQRKKFLSCREYRCIEINAHISKPSTIERGQKLHTGAILTLKDTGVDSEYYEANISSCEQPNEVKEFLATFGHHPKGLFTMSGNPGTGKTYAAIACLEKYLSRGGRAAYFLKYSELYQRWLTLSQNGGQPLSLLETLQTQELLIIDDFAYRKPSEAFADFIFLLIDNRKSSNSGTIITTNLSSMEIKEIFGSSFISRLASGKYLQFGGTDRRIPTNLR